MKTNKTYEIDVKEKYIDDKKSGKLRGDLHKLTPKKIKTICLNLIDENLSIDDVMSMRNFFELKEEDDLRDKIKKYDIDGFRPICKFLKGETESIQEFYALELIAIIINFKPRPYNKYYKHDLDCSLKEEKKTQVQEDTTSPNETVTYITNKEGNKSNVIVKSKNKKLFHWFSSASATNLILFKIAIITTFTITISLLVFNNQPRWMIWQEDHYIEVKFDDNKLNINQLKLYKEDRILNFRQIQPDCNTIFFKENGEENIWYGKNAKGELEYFTDLAKHPKTGKTLKKITPYMIRKYICKTY